MSAKFMATHGSARIELVPIEKETDQCVWVRSWTTKGKHTGEPRRKTKASSYENFFDTWELAHAFLLACAQERVAEAREELQRANDRLGNVKGMKPPTGSPQ